ncbi:unnamed protein product, partial [Rotaria socialis]
MSMCIGPKQYIVTKNVSQAIRSYVWDKFKFPAKVRTDGLHDVIPGFVTCSDCFKTLVYD